MTRIPRPPVHHPDPVLVEATRGPLVESLHRGVVAVLANKGLGVAVKIDDGANRAAEVAILAVPHHLGAVSAAEEAALGDHLSPTLYNVAGQSIGMLRPAPGWLN